MKPRWVKDELDNLLWHLHVGGRYDDSRYDPKDEKRIVRDAKKAILKLVKKGTTIEYMGCACPECSSYCLCKVPGHHQNPTKESK